MVKLTVLIAVSIVILVAIVYAVGVAATLEAVRQAGVGAFAGVGVTMAASILLRAIAWSVLNRPVAHRIRFRTLLAAEIVGTSGNMLTPSTYLGGEALKVAYIGRKTSHPYHELAGTVLLAKYLEGLSFILFFSFGTIVALVRFKEVLFVSYPGAGVTLVALAGSLLTLAGVMWLSLSRRWRPVTRLVRILVRLRIFAQFFLRLCRRARRMEDQVSRVFCEEGQAARVGFLLLMASHVVIFTRPAVFFLLGARIPLGPAKLCLIFVVSQALLAFQLTPSGVGTLDGGLIAAFALVGLPRAEAQAMAYLLCLRFWDVLIIGTGAFIAARAGAGFLTQKAEAANDMHLVEEPAEDGCADPQDD